MSWAANRMTTREEDRAYCLMGIFGVNMPTLYGEGMMAFQRLQEEIMRLHDDSTLFAWSLLDYKEQGPMNILSAHSQDSPLHLHLFAKSPDFFSHSKNIVSDTCIASVISRLPFDTYCRLRLTYIVATSSAQCSSPLSLPQPIAF